MLLGSSTRSIVMLRNSHGLGLTMASRAGKRSSQSEHSLCQRVQAFHLGGRLVADHTDLLKHLPTACRHRTPAAPLPVLAWNKALVSRMYRLSAGRDVK